MTIPRPRLNSELSQRNEIKLFDLGCGNRESLTDKIRASLKDVDGQPPFLLDSLQWDDRVDSVLFSDFQRRAKNGQFCGVFVIAVPEEFSSEVDILLRQDALFVWAKVVQLLNDKQYVVTESERLIGAIALGELVGAAGGHCAILLEGAASIVPESDYSCAGRPFRVRTAFVDDLDLSFFGILTGGLKCRRTTAHMRFNIEDHPVGGIRDFRLRPRKECDRWYQLEFDSSEARTHAQELCSHALVTLCADERKPLYRQFLTAIRMADHLKHRTLEGVPFEFTVFLATNYADQVQANQNRTEVVKFEPSSLYFNFNYWDKLCDHIEMIQARDLWLVVDLTDSSVRSIIDCSAHRSAREEVPRHLGLAAEVRQNFGVILHVRDGQTIEVYGRGTLELKYNGAEWVVAPFQRLHEALGSHIARDVDERESIIEHLEGAIALIQDSHESSIIVLLSEEDEERLVQKRYLDQISLVPLRSIVTAPQGLHVRSLASSQLAGLFHLDGAHMIARDGRVVSSCRMVVAWQENKGNEAEAESGGTGRNAAMLLSTAFSSSCVIKVSASGGHKILSPETKGTNANWYGHL